MRTRGRGGGKKGKERRRCMSACVGFEPLHGKRRQVFFSGSSFTMLDTPSTLRYLDNSTQTSA